MSFDYSFKILLAIVYNCTIECNSRILIGLTHSLFERANVDRLSRRWFWLGAPVGSFVDLLEVDLTSFLASSCQAKEEVARGFHAPS